ncbi:MAG TPA: hypothetical protein VFU10_01065 [Gaiellaceae bacterium]|nr:hypothetical protein [Gaiellaceae bacterium]
MQRIILALAIVALAAPFAALAADPPSSGNGASPAQACKTEQTAMGNDAFKALYGTNADKSNAFGKCVSKKATQRTKSQSNAASACRTEQADTTFAANHGGKTFDQFYGTGKNGKDAFGKCVSSKAKAANDAADANVLNAVKQCKAERANDPAAFKSKYGKNGNKANAMGKCVSQTAKAKA